jgi:hypothetical protein
MRLQRYMMLVDPWKGYNGWIPIYQGLLRGYGAGVMILHGLLGCSTNGVICIGMGLKDTTTNLLGHDNYLFWAGI